MRLLTAFRTSAAEALGRSWLVGPCAVKGLNPRTCTRAALSSKGFSAFTAAFKWRAW